MEHYKHWAEKLEVGDRVIATIRHPNDGTKNIKDTIVIVIKNSKNLSHIQGALNGVLYLIPYNELTEYSSLI